LIEVEEDNVYPLEDCKTKCFQPIDQ